MKKSLSRGFTAGSLLILSSFIMTSCIKQLDDTVDINTNVAYPGKLVALNNYPLLQTSTANETSEIGAEFLLLNTNAGNKYTNASIQHYMFDALGNPMLQNVFKVKTHASDFVLSEDNKLLALSFDASQKNTTIEFYDFSDKTQLKPLTTLNLSLFSAGGQQAVKQLSFFRVDGSAHYFLYGVIFSTPFDTGKGANIPPRVFVAKIENDLSRAEVLFVLSYGVGDSNSLVQKSDSLNTFGTDVQYMFGSNAPIYDAQNNLLIAFPSGSMNGFNDNSVNTFPPMNLSARNYFAGRENANLNCSVEQSCVQPDLRTVSLFAVDMKSVLQNKNINLSTYFVPLAWNSNGIPYGHKTNGVVINDTEQKSNDVSSFSFQSNFWSSYLIPETSSLLVAKNGTSFTKDTTNGDEIFQIRDFDVLAENIRITSEQIPNYDDDKIKDFKLLASRQMFDAYHQLASSNAEDITPPELRSRDNVINPQPLTPYMYSRTSGTNLFANIATAVYGFSTICQKDTNICTPYWVRSSYKGIGGTPGRDSSWLTTHVPDTAYKLGDNTTFPDAQFDPKKPNVYAFPDFGAQVCTTLGTQTIYCANFLSGEFKKFHLTASGFVPEK